MSALDQNIFSNLVINVVFTVLQWNLSYE